MITHAQKDIVRGLLARAKAHDYQLVVFWQDHFYTRNGKFGYPVCIQLQNPITEQVEDAHIVYWSSSRAVCAENVAEIETYLVELESEVTHANDH